MCITCDNYIVAFCIAFIRVYFSFLVCVTNVRLLLFGLLPSLSLDVSWLESIGWLWLVAEAKLANIRLLRIELPVCILNEFYMLLILLLLLLSVVNAVECNAKRSHAPTPCKLLNRTRS